MAAKDIGLERILSELLTDALQTALNSPATRAAIASIVRMELKAKPLPNLPLPPTPPARPIHADPPPRPDKLLYTRKEAAHVLSLSVKTLDRMIENKVLGTKRNGRRVLIPAADVRRVSRINVLSHDLA